MVRKTDRDMLVEMYTTLPFLRENIVNANNRVKVLERRVYKVEGQYAKIMAAATTIASVIGLAAVIISKVV